MFKGRATSGFRPKLHSCAEILSLERLDMRSAVGREGLDDPTFGRESPDMGRESLDMPKVGRKCLDMGRESMCPDFCDICPDFRYQIWASADIRGPRLHVQTFQTQTLGVTMHFGSKSRCGATLTATHVQIFHTLCPDFPYSNSRRDSALWV